MLLLLVLMLLLLLLLHTVHMRRLDRLPVLMSITTCYSRMVMLCRRLREGVGCMVWMVRGMGWLDSANWNCVVVVSDAWEPARYAVVGPANHPVHAATSRGLRWNSKPVWQAG
ncbi:hypothetical protein F5883DRAFT_540379 [Diaporthe sp. PMI_573]|nr:hypothetical protein F5883DRAFT_540379 [Diaporthaceae sp. PMI_573]